MCTRHPWVSSAAPAPPRTAGLSVRSRGTWDGGCCRLRVHSVKRTCDDEHGFDEAHTLGGAPAPNGLSARALGGEPRVRARRSTAPKARCRPCPRSAARRRRSSRRAAIRCCPVRPFSPGCHPPTTNSWPRWFLSLSHAASGARVRSASRAAWRRRPRARSACSPRSSRRRRRPRAAASATTRR